MDGIAGARGAGARSTEPFGARPGEPPPSVVLVSGSPRGVNTSFSRQLERLAASFNRKGVGAVMAWSGSDGACETLSRSASGGLHPGSSGLLLGHPDQFHPLLHGNGGGGPLFLWTQLSRPVGEAARLFGRAIPVPLTSATAGFLAASGLARVRGPIPHGVDTRLFRPRSSRERHAFREETGLKGKFVVGTVAAFSRRKRFDRILDAFALFAASRGDAHLLVKTDRIRSLEGEDLARMAGERGVSDRITVVTGESEEEEMARLYSLMDVYVNLSEWEGFCIPVIEAMASGVPVIAQPGQGPGEIVPYRELLVEGSERVEEGGTVLLHARPERAAARMREAAENPGAMMVLSERGRGEAETRYDIEIVGGQWLALIAEEACPE